MQSPLKALALLGTVAVVAAANAGSYKTSRYTVNNPKRWTVNLEFPVFSGEGALGDVANNSMRAEINLAKDFVKHAAEDQKQDHKLPEQPYPYECKFKVLTMRPDLIVVRFDDDVYMGGAHGSQTTRFYCFGFKNGQAKRLKLQDLFRPGVNARTLMSRIVMAHLKKNPDAQWIQDGTVKSLDAKNAEQFAISKTGLDFTFNQYEMASYAAGPISTTVSFSEIRNSLDPNGPLRGLLGGH